MSNTMTREQVNTCPIKTTKRHTWICTLPDCNGDAHWYEVA